MPATASGEPPEKHWPLYGTPLRCVKRVCEKAPSRDFAFVMVDVTATKSEV
jgi:hypothetical protein